MGNAIKAIGKTVGKVAGGGALGKVLGGGGLGKILGGGAFGAMLPGGMIGGMIGGGGGGIAGKILGLLAGKKKGGGEGGGGDLRQLMRGGAGRLTAGAQGMGQDDGGEIEAPAPTIGLNALAAAQAAKRIRMEAGMNNAPNAAQAAGIPLEANSQPVNRYQQMIQGLLD